MRWAALLALLALPAQAALYDEFEVHDLEIPETGQWSVDQHANYGIRGFRQPLWRGAQPSQGAGYLSTEIGLGVAQGWGAALYLPGVVAAGYTPAGAKLRNLFRFFHEDGLSFGVLSQISLLSRRISPEALLIETRPVVTWQSGPWMLVGGVGFTAASGPGLHSLLSPQARVNYTLPSRVELGVEHYADLGRIERLSNATRQAHQTFVTIGMPVGRVEVNFGLGHGWTGASDAWVSRLRLGVEF